MRQHAITNINTEIAHSFVHKVYNKRHWNNNYLRKVRGREGGRDRGGEKEREEHIYIFIPRIPKEREREGREWERERERK